MIQAADVGKFYYLSPFVFRNWFLCINKFLGVGIVGKEGKQASLAADFSVTQFSYLTKLLCK